MSHHYFYVLLYLILVICVFNLFSSYRDSIILLIFNSKTIDIIQCFMVFLFLISFFFSFVIFLSLTYFEFKSLLFYFLIVDTCIIDVVLYIMICCPILAAFTNVWYVVTLWKIFSSFSCDFLSNLWGFC